jgi:5-methylthioadenosine/S-adenosylhomocysteine deaminase
MGSPSKPLLISNARVLTWDDARTEHDRADILVENGRITGIGSNLTERETFRGRILEADGLLAIPGLINAHLHSPGNFMRGTLDGLPLEVFMLYEVPPLAGAADAGRIGYLRTLLGAIEMLKLGITSVLDDAFFVPLTSTSAIDAILSAYRDSGMRATVALDQPLAIEYEKYPYLVDLLPAHIKQHMEQAPRETEAGMRAHYDHLIGRWHGAADGRLSAAVSCSAPQRAPPPYLQMLAELSRAHDLPYFCHILETRVQRVLGWEKYGASLIRYAHDLGILDERMQAIHAIWIDDADIALLAKSGCTVAHNPVCNLRLGSGIMPFRKLRDAGVPICLGTDEAVSDDSHNVWAAAKMAGLIHNLADADYRRWPMATEVLDCVWRGGARAMRRSGEVGVLAPGAVADIALLDLASDAFTPLNDVPRQLVYSETGASVRHTIVAGEIVVENGRVTTLDEAAIKAEVRALQPELTARTAALRKSAAELEPYYRAMYLKCAVGPAALPGKA